MVLRGKNGINGNSEIQICCSIETGRTEGEFLKEGKKRSFFRTMKLLLMSKTKLLCTENKNPCPLVTVLSSVWIHFGERVTGCWMKGPATATLSALTVQAQDSSVTGSWSASANTSLWWFTALVASFIPSGNELALPTLVRVCNQRTMKLGLLKRMNLEGWKRVRFGSPSFLCFNF